MIKRVLASTVLMLVSGLVASFEKRAEAREIVAVGMAHAPTLRNYVATARRGTITEQLRQKLLLPRSARTAALISTRVSLEGWLRGKVALGACCRSCRR